MPIGNRRPIHPGEILREVYLEPLNMSAGKLSRALDLPRTRIERIVKEEVAITPDTALWLARFFGSSPELWLNMQVSYDLSRKAPELQKVLAGIPVLERDRDGAVYGPEAPAGA